jgi:hypothetical protein
MSRIEVLRPDRPSAPGPAVELAARGAPELGTVLTLIENGKPRARDLLRMIAEELRPRLSFTDVEVFSKPTAAKAIDADEAEMLAVRSRLVITGLGD